MIEGAITKPNDTVSLVWAESLYLNSREGNHFTEEDAVTEGGIKIPLGDGLQSDMRKAWGCKDCKFVIVDCK